MGLIPQRDLLYIIPIDNEPVSSTGLIIIPEAYQLACKQGVVMYRGPKTSGEIQVGAHVFFNQWMGDEILIEGEGRFIVMKEDDIEAVLDGKESLYLLSIDQVKHAIQVAAAEEAGKVKEEEKSVVLRTAEHIKEVIGNHFQRSLY